ncbi:histidinol dehydrogenase [Peptoclostridium litorale DSM 5388]|uniref:Histidinol dehydrogenase n=1 Tax=Peptoclostridium litorale DSM 5388 TaxID=1121324 RepID=A0A069RDL9_PEPLI|nr:histidinol dehydrogenase [Peptoclostridium litorale]KDR95101.1 histidinol dehydrogenase HisD [Peptoclostridium litorale DSM 5388]SIN74991.1 histidinol dehydrogenase [Peptoclostridium litorale DSM 5388]
MIKILDATGEGSTEILKDILDRGDKESSDITKSVMEILAGVEKDGDTALKEFTKKFDGVEIDDFLVSQDEIEAAYLQCDEDFIKAMKRAKDNIWDYHQKQLKESWITNKSSGIILGQLYNPMEKVGIYVPGGTAAYPSSVLMNAIPAKVAGVGKIIMVTPPLKDGTVNKNILAAARIAGVDKVYKVGGAQAVAALANGTQTIGKVDKIVGPGNIYVAAAKRLVFGKVDIDMIAGPSEVLIVADETANPRYVAADLLSQAEHDVLASSILVTTSPEIAKEVAKEVEIQTKTLSRREIIEKSLSDYGAIVVVKSLDDAMKFANEIAPEHLEMAVKDPFSTIGKIKNAGAIFLGEYSPEPLGDYFAGPNHTLPTSGTARFFSPLGVDDFVKKSSLVYYDRKNLEQVKDDIIKIAQKEGLDAHANSVEVRFE